MQTGRYAYWGLIEHVQGMMGNDGCYLREIEENGGRYPDGLAARIADDFGVIRNISKEIGIKSLTCELHGLAKLWPADMSARAKSCCEIAQSHFNLAKKAAEERADGKRPFNPYSAVTKLMWFLKPDGWTMFDSLAQKGLSGTGTSQKTVERFFQSLDDTGFESHCGRIRQQCRSTGLDWIYAERVIDKFLLFRGSDFGDGAYFDWAKRKGGHFLKCLKRDAPEFHEKLVTLATKVALELPDNSFETNWVKKQWKRAS